LVADEGHVIDLGEHLMPELLNEDASTELALLRRLE